MPPVLRQIETSLFAGRIEELIAVARRARMRAYGKYSGFMVGTAVLATNGEIYAGANVECVSHNGMHAEETALSALRMGASSDVRPVLIVTVGAREDAEGDAPIIQSCGQCRQAIAEWVLGTTYDVDVIVSATPDGPPVLCSIREYLPLTFAL